MKEYGSRAVISIRLSFLSAAILALCLAPQVIAAPIVVPNSLEHVEGNFENTYPFSCSFVTGYTSMRYQQVYAADQFSGPMLITRIAFRPDDQNGGSFDVELLDVQINLSTTEKNPDGLHSTFDLNVGWDDTIVWPAGPLPLSSEATGGPPRNFDITIDLKTPFYYNPSLGNLLLDVRNNSCGITTFFDAEETPSDPISRAFTLAAGVDSPEAAIRATSGLVTQFEFDDAALEVDIDIKFCSNPNAFNCKKKGVVPVIIFGTDTFDVLDIDTNTLALCLASNLEECTGAPRDWSVYDRGDPDELGLAACTIEETSPGSGVFVEVGNPDEYEDLGAVFDAREVRDILEDFCEAGEKGGSSEALVIIGETLDGRVFTSLPIPSIGVDQLVKVNK